MNGVDGGDTFTLNDLTGVAALTTVNLNGFGGDDLFNFVASSAGALVVNGHGGLGTNVVQGPNSDAIWNVTAASR